MRLDTPGAPDSFSHPTPSSWKSSDWSRARFCLLLREASDTVSKTVTDLYFLEVQPYDRAYYQSQQSERPAAMQSRILCFYVNKSS